MTYRYAKEPVDGSAFAPGSVFYSSPGRTAFPVRLASEILQRCVAFLKNEGAVGSHTLYDPCCGGGYLLATLDLLHRDSIARLYGSDIDPQALELAERNLSLLTPEGLGKRVEELEALFAHYGKASHRLALENAETLRERLTQSSSLGSPAANLFAADATRPGQLTEHIEKSSIDLLITDLPYGNLSSWRSAGGEAGVEAETPAATRLLGSVSPVLARPSVVALASDKTQSPGHQDFYRVGRLQIGKRRVTFLAIR